MGIGELVWDMLPTGRQLGGAPVNFTYWCGRLGAAGYPVSAVGGDEPGQQALERLARTGLDVGYVQLSALPTGRVDVTFSGDGIPAYEIVEGVAWDALEADDRTLALAARADAVCWGSLAQRAERSRKAVAAILAATGPDCLKVFDINIRRPWYGREVVADSLAAADVLKLNEEELPLVASIFGIEGADAEIAAELVRRFALRYVVYTAGADRSEIYGAGGLLSGMKTPRVEVIDTVGAGDSFTAAFVTSLLQGEAIADCHRKAVDTAAGVCRQHGAIPEAL